MKITLDVTDCRSCPHVTNSSQLHTDSFTSEPAKLTWFCKKNKNIIYDVNKIDPLCPLTAGT